MKLPLFITQLIDHIYISDRRSFVFYDQFDLVVQTDNIFTSEKIVSSLLSNTTHITANIGTMDNSEKVVDIMKEYTLHSKRILLYSDSIKTACQLFIAYVRKTYQFSTTDLFHMVNSSRFPHFLSTQMNEILRLYTV